jgi:hypothetical protein
MEAVHKGTVYIEQDAQKSYNMHTHSQRIFLRIKKMSQIREFLTNLKTRSHELSIYGAIRKILLNSVP